MSGKSKEKQRRKNRGVSADENKAANEEVAQNGRPLDTQEVLDKLVVSRARPGRIAKDIERITKRIDACVARGLVMPEEESA